MPESGLTRREVLKAAAAAGVASAWLPRDAGAQGSLASLAPEEPVDKTMQRLFGSRPVRDGAYKLVSRLRYRIFGEWKPRPLARPEFRERFIDGPPS